MGVENLDLILPGAVLHCVVIKIAMKTIFKQLFETELINKHMW